MAHHIRKSLALMVAGLACALMVSPSFGATGGFGGQGSTGGHAGGGGGGAGGFGGSFGDGRNHDSLRLPGNGTGGFGGQQGNQNGNFGYGSRGRGPYGVEIGGRRGFRPGFGYGQNGDGLSDYAPYGRPVYGCDPTTPSRAHPGCGYGYGYGYNPYGY